MTDKPKIGVLALQGDFDAHRCRLEQLGAEVVLVRKPEQLDEIDGLVIPGGESTTFLKLLGEAGFEKLRQFVGPRDYEIIVVDRGSRDGTRAWLKAQPDVRLITRRQWFALRHGHGEAAEAGAAQARHDRVVLLDSDAHPVAADWLANSVDRLDDRIRLAGAVILVLIFWLGVVPSPLFSLIAKVVSALPALT